MDSTSTFFFLLINQGRHVQRIYAPNTIHLEKLVFNAFFNWLLEAKLLEQAFNE